MPLDGQFVTLTKPFVELKPAVQVVPSVAEISCQAPLRLLADCRLRTRTTKPGHRNVAGNRGSNRQIATGKAAVGTNVAGAEERLNIWISAERIRRHHIRIELR